ncbi:MAG: hypothetical protein N4A50_13105 [Vallitalea sp.]|jgi:sugar phosphate isomerase/epimerase|nr:hypothetical protein [Vallitalea sp.]
MRIGCCARFFNNYKDEVSFAKEYDFDFMQLWCDKNGLADKHFDVIHEHLPLGKGELDFGYVFSNALGDFNRDLVIEVVTNNEDIIDSRERISRSGGNK